MATKLADIIKQKLVEFGRKNPNLVGKIQTYEKEIGGESRFMPDFSKMFSQSKAGQKTAAIERAVEAKVGKDTYGKGKAVTQAAIDLFVTGLPKMAWEAEANVPDVLMNKKLKAGEKAVKIGAKTVLPMAALVAGGKVAEKVVGKLAGGSLPTKVATEVFKRGNNFQKAYAVEQALRGANVVGRIGHAALRGGISGGIFGGTSGAGEAVDTKQKLPEALKTIGKSAVRGMASGAVLGSALQGEKVS